MKPHRGDRSTPSTVPPTCSPVQDRTSRRLVSPELAQPREATLQARQHERGARAILQVGGMHHDLEQQTAGIHEHMPLATLHLFAAVVPMRPAWFARLDRLAIDDGGAGSGLASYRSTHPLAQHAVNALPGGSPAPEANRLEDRGPLALVTEQAAPGAARA